MIAGGCLVVALAGGGAAYAVAQTRHTYTPTAADQETLAKADAFTSQIEAEKAKRDEPPTLKPLPAGAHVLIFGDSWTRGRGADDPATQGYAPVLAQLEGWDAQVAGEGGTGYLNPGSGKQVPYTERAKTLAVRFTPDLIILQGSQNDGGQQLGKLPAAITATVDTFRARFPKAQMVMIGPGPVNSDEVNTIVSNAAGANKIPFVDEIAPGWMAGANATKYMLPDYHPNSEGHAWLAKNIKAALASLTKKP